jgi:5-methylthioadenosine/S-adenosylhomocysteine deaminase
MTQLDESEIEHAAQAGLHVAHCPESNLKLASGFCPVHALMRAGVNVCLGTDGAASNNDLDMLGEMRTAALIAKAVSADAQALPAAAALRMATLNGAKALGWDSEIGSITVGKAADLAAIDLGGIATQPVYDPVSQIVYSATRADVTDVWVAGRRLVQNKHLTSLDQPGILKHTSVWRARIAASP